jgi:hypothetical protein
VKSDDFFEEAQTPDFQDEMIFQLDRARRDGQFFSREALDATLANVEKFLLARMIGYERREGSPPQKLAMRIGLTWETLPEDLLEASGKPWWSIGDQGSQMDPLIDSERRKMRDG